MFQTYLYVLPHCPDPPRFEAGSGVVQFSAVIGSNFTLDCSWSGNPSGSLQVTYQLQEDEDMLDNVLYDNTSQSVTVEGADTGNKGCYICTAENAIAITRLIYNVIVGGKAHTNALVLVVVANQTSFKGSLLRVLLSFKMLYSTTPLRSVTTSLEEEKLPSCFLLIAYFMDYMNCTGVQGAVTGT